jgi:hypothetical protein
MNRWGKPPRPDQKLSQALKGLDDKYTLYHYQTDISHLLIGPGGIFSLLPYNQTGNITYDSLKGRWKQSGGNFFLKTFGGESLGKPDLDSRYAVSDIQKFLTKKNINLGDYVPESVIVFTNDKATVMVEDSPIPAVTSEKLKEFIRKRGKSNPLNPELVKSIQTTLTP